jgi:hypothetical protein
MVSVPFYYDYFKNPPDQIVDNEGKVLVGPIIVITEKYNTAKCACIKLSNYLSHELLSTYGLTRTNKVFHSFIKIYNKKKKYETVSQLPMHDVFIEYVPNCILDSVFTTLLIHGYLRISKLEPTFTGKPVRIDKASQFDRELIIGDGFPRELIILPDKRNLWINKIQ